MKIYNRFAKTPPSQGGDVGKARFQASPSMNGKAVESFEKKTPSFQDGEAYKTLKKPIAKNNRYVMRLFSNS